GLRHLGLHLLGHLGDLADVHDLTSGASTSSPPVMRSTPSRSARPSDSAGLETTAWATVSGSSSTLLATHSIAQLPPSTVLKSCSIAGARVAALARMKERSSGKASVT